MNALSELLRLAEGAATYLPRSTVLTVGRLLLAIIFILSAFAKLRNPRMAAYALVDFRVVNEVKPVYGAALGSAEGVLAIWLVSGFLVEAAVATAFGMLGGFSLLLARAIRNGEQFPCYCFGRSDKQVGKGPLARTAAMALLSGLVLLVSRSVPVEEPFLSASELLLSVSIAGAAYCLSLLPSLMRSEAGRVV